MTLFQADDFYPDGSNTTTPERKTQLDTALNTFTTPKVTFRYGRGCVASSGGQLTCKHVMDKGDNWTFSNNLKNHTLGTMYNWVLVPSVQPAYNADPMPITYLKLSDDSGVAGEQTNTPETGFILSTEDTFSTTGTHENEFYTDLSGAMTAAENTDDGFVYNVSKATRVKTVTNGASYTARGCKAGTAASTGTCFSYTANGSVANRTTYATPTPSDAPFGTDELQSYPLWEIIPSEGDQRIQLTESFVLELAEES